MSQTFERIFKGKISKSIEGGIIMKHLIMTILLAMVMTGTTYAHHDGTNHVALVDHHNETQPYTAIVPSIQMLTWVSEYIDTYEKGGIYIAVEEAIMDGRTPDEIMDASMNIDTINPMMTVAALYCANATPSDIRFAVEQTGISDMILVAGFEQAKTVCGDGITDTQAYTARGLQFNGIPGGGNNGGNVYGSPSTL